MGWPLYCTPWQPPPPHALPPQAVMPPQPPPPPYISPHPPPPPHPWLYPPPHPPPQPPRWRRCRQPASEKSVTTSKLQAATVKATNMLRAICGSPLSKVCRVRRETVSGERKFVNRL